MNTIDTLQDFIKRAERNYKYKPNTATALSGGVKLFGSVMTEDELSQGSFPLDRLDEIAERILVKYGDRYSVDSLQTYKSRINRVVGDFKRYGSDAKSMASWNPLSTQRKRSPKTDNTGVKPSATTTSTESSKKAVMPVTNDTQSIDIPGLQDIRLPLADNRNIVIYYPMDLSEAEAEKIGNVLKGIAALSKAE